MGGLDDLLYLDLSDNELSGEIPTELASLGNLTGLTLGGNQFTGCLPEGLWSVPDNDFSVLGLPFCSDR